MIRRKRPEASERGNIWRTMRTYIPRSFPYARPYRRLLIATIVITILEVVLSLAQPWPLAFLVDGVLAGRQPPGVVARVLGTDTGRLIVFAVGLGFTLALVNAVLNVMNSAVQTRMEQGMILDFRSDLFAHVQKLSLTFHDGSRKGALMFAINSQAAAMGEIVLSLLPLAQAVLTLVGMFIVVYLLQPQLALLAMTVVPLVYYAIRHYGNNVEPELRRVRNLEGTSLSIVHEAMSMMRVIVAFSRERYEHRRFHEQGKEAVDARARLTVRQTKFSLGVNLITSAGTALVLGFGARYVVRGGLTVGELLVVISYIAAVYQPLEQISGALAAMQDRLIALEAAVDLLDLQPEVEDPPGGVELDTVEGRVTFEDVHFSYSGRVDTLKGISFSADPGEIVAIVGQTGAGKSTLVSMIPRFFDPSAGAIMIDDHDIRTIKLESLRGQISIVLQDPLLFSGTIADNIRYGDLDAAQEDIERAARAANAHGFIERLPQQYDTMLGEGGARLSGGERQRISIARAFLKGGNIVILDEPTSSIDSRTEAVILDALAELVKGRTTFMIAHRLATVRYADRILVIDSGELVQEGTHAELIATDGVYRELYEAQMGPVASADADAGTADVADDQVDAAPPRLFEALKELADVAASVGNRLRETQGASSDDEAGSVDLAVTLEPAAAEVSDDAEDQPRADQGETEGAPSAEEIAAKLVAAAFAALERDSAAGAAAESGANDDVAVAAEPADDHQEVAVIDMVTWDKRRAPDHGRPPTTRPRRLRKLDLNRASVRQLAALPGSDVSTAKAIIQQRRVRRGFTSVSDLIDVPGITRSQVEQMRAHVTVDGESVAVGDR